MKNEKKSCILIMRIILNKKESRFMTIIDPSAEGKILRIVDIAGGEGVRRRLFSLGFQPGDRVECGPRGIWGGPIVLKNLRTGVSMAVGRGIARRIVVAVDERV